MNYPDSVRYLYSLGNEVKSAKFSLETITALAKALGNPERSCRFVHVAGTNGKGSVCAMLESSLRAAGMRTGLYTSPHLAEPTERIQIAGTPVTAEEFSGAFDIVHAAAEQLLGDGTLECHPTYFETVTAMAFVLFERTGVEIAVLETGLGGRLDATNIVTPALSVITRVDFDHESLLGRSIESIASEKAGILKPGIPAVFSTQRPEAESALRARATSIGSEVWSTADWLVSAEIDARGSNIAARFRHDTPMHVRCPLAGEHQVENAVTAIAALRVLGIDAEAIERGIAAAKWPARLELASTRPDIILDGAHNPSGARALAAYIERFYGNRRVTLVYGAMRDKAVAEMTGILFPRVSQVIATAPAQERAARPETIRALGPPATRTASSVADALRMAVEITGPEDAIFVAGSLFVVAEARSILAGNHSPAVSRVPSL